MHAAKTLGWAGATPLLTAFIRPNQSGVAPARHAGSVTMFCPRAYREAIEPECKVQTILNSKGENLDASSESTNQTTEDYTNPTSTRRPSKNESSEVRRVPRQLSVLRRVRGIKAGL